MRFLFALLMALAAPAWAANTWGTDMSDLWWNPNESGWGLNVAHQQEIVFATLFVYAQDGTAHWYVGPALSSTGDFTFTGTFYETTGPYFNGSFNPNSVTVRAVGTATLVLDSVWTGNFSYTVDGVSVSKDIQRQTFRLQDIRGTYTGALIGTQTGCGSTTSFNTPGNIVITQDANTFTVTARGINNSQCVYSGFYLQLGRMSQIQGTFTCAGASTGNFTMYEIEAGSVGFMGRYQATYGGTCREDGRIGGVR